MLGLFKFTPFNQFSKSIRPSVFRIFSRSHHHEMYGIVEPNYKIVSMKANVFNFQSINSQFNKEINLVQVAENTNQH